MKRYILAASLFVLFSSCEKETIPLYDTNVKYLYFAESNSNIIRFSFKTSVDPQTGVIAIPLEMVGTAPVQDLTFKVEANAKLTTAKAVNYSIPSAPLFSKGVFEDVLLITVHNSAELATKELDIVINIADNENFLAGPTKNNLCTIRISDAIAQPSWWTADFDRNFLGKYSDEKYRQFILATGVIDITDMEISRIQALCRDLIYHLRRLKDEGKEVMERDGTPMLETINYKG